MELKITCVVKCERLSRKYSKGTTHMPTKKQVPQTTTQPVQPVATTTPKVEEVKPQATAAAPAKPEEAKVGKQQLAVMQLVVALREQRQIEVKPEQLKQDGKYVVVLAGEGWPEIYIGPSGGFNLPSVKSYPKADLATMVQADKLYAKQAQRAEKKAVAAAPKPQAPTAQATA